MVGMDEDQRKMLDKWNEEHDCKLKEYSGAIGGRLTYSVTPTSLGTVLIVSCCCGEEIDLTDYNW